MKKRKLFIPLLGATTVVASVGTVISCQQPQNSESQAVVDNLRWNSGVWNTVSAEKDAMTINLYNAAKKQFDEMIKQTDILELDKVKVENDKVVVSNTSDNKSIPVVFMDIDETVLNNFAFQNYLVLNKDVYNSKNWNAFIQDKKAIKIAGAIEFIKYVYSKGGVVMYNSNREQENQLVPTRENLISEGLDAKYLPDWVFWMQGVDLSKTEAPWKHIKKDSNGKRIKSEKEERMNLVNEKTWDLSEYNGSGNKISFKTVMRVGDNFDDFNDIASGKKLNPERNKVLNDTGKLFGNFDISVKGVKYKKNENGQVIKEDETWSESYVLIGGNSSYGGWESGLAQNFYGIGADKQVEALTNALKTNLWIPKTPVK
ncbi:HAD family acid phosphatase [Mesomycoplasma lagogenitalium]|uniref:HAD family acid phosphatase n=1 Tax=Mesomycoplasma lagogenitalium TaxID=171286 RepID=A0ABY8LUD3_9BACT|nr:HAD family acid phosphatase [Mesomycoplasma lagogenitalium]WGI36848.1 HAD family acid phosphatase [Mesomycoplasma lagogenitalium]